MFTAEMIAVGSPPFFYFKKVLNINPDFAFKNLIR